MLEEQKKQIGMKMLKEFKYICGHGIQFPIVCVTTETIDIGDRCFEVPTDYYEIIAKSIFEPLGFKVRVNELFGTGIPNLHGNQQSIQVYLP
jgi:hypothetical protein